jgi:cobalamin-dependent methionine synthase I
MLIVGEHINTSRRRIAEAVEKQDAEFIVQVAKKQADAGADFIDVNAGTFVNREAEYLCWLVKTVQDAVDLPLCLDSPSSKALSEAIKHHRGEPMINSISLEKERFDDMLPIVTAQPCRVVALCMTETAMPVTSKTGFKPVPN